MKTVSIIAYGAGNVASLRFAFERLGARVEMVSDPAGVEAAERLVLPGVGAAGYAMARLGALGLIEPIRAFARPMLGVCLGQQLMFQASDEGGGDLLGVLAGRVMRLVTGPERPVPHTGWSRLDDLSDDPLLAGVARGDWVYFNHSYVCPDGDGTIARADYGGPVPAAVRRGPRWGCQFHPERSSTTGARVLANFLELSA